MSNLLRASSAIVQVGGDITGVETAPTLATEGFQLPAECAAVIWDFQGGTSATITFYEYNPVLGGWSTDGTQTITGNEAVVQQAAGSRVFAIITTHGGGTYKRTAQVLM